MWALVLAVNGALRGAEQWALLLFLCADLVLSVGAYAAKLFVIDPDFVIAAMDAQVRRVLFTLRSANASVETKSSELNDLKSNIKHHVVADGVVSLLFEVIRLALASQHSQLVGQGLSTMAHLTKRLHLQEYDFSAFTPRILPLVIESIGDRKDRHRSLALQCLGDFWLCCPQDVERLVRDSAMSSKNPRTKESSMHWLVSVSRPSAASRSR